MATTRKSSTATQSASVKVSLTFTKETPGTYRFDNDDRDAVITSLYVRKAAFPNGAPTTVTLTVEAGK